MYNFKNRLMDFLMPALLVTLFSIYAVPAHGGGYFAQNPDSQPSIFTYGLRGLGVGALNGMAAGYLIIYSDTNSMENWRTFLVSTGIGTLGGAVLGLGVGFLDLAMYSKYPNGNYVGLGAVILRDSLYGALFGTLVGAIGGGIAAIVNKEPESIPLGAAIGTLSGTAFGILVGVIEGRVLTRRHQKKTNRADLHLSLSSMTTINNKMILGPGVMGTF